MHKVCHGQVLALFTEMTENSWTWLVLRMVGVIYVFHSSVVYSVRSARAVGGSCYGNLGATFTNFRAATHVNNSL